MRSGVPERTFAVLALQEGLRALATAQASIAEALSEIARDGSDGPSLTVAQGAVDAAIRRLGGDATLVLSRASEALARAYEELEREDG